MEFFEKLGDVANKTCKYTTQQTSRLATIAKLKWKMSDYKCRIDDLYEELGKIEYENNVRENMEDYEEQRKDKCNKIDELASKIETCRRKILKLNNKRQCQNCYTEIYSAFNYCPNCGESQNAILKTKEENSNRYDEDIQEEQDENEQMDSNMNIDTDDFQESYTEGEDTKREV